MIDIFIQMFYIVNKYLVLQQKFRNVKISNYDQNNKKLLTFYT